MTLVCVTEMLFVMSTDSKCFIAILVTSSQNELIHHHNYSGLSLYGTWDLAKQFSLYHEYEGGRPTGQGRDFKVIPFKRMFLTLGGVHYSERPLYIISVFRSWQYSMFSPNYM